MKSGDVIIRHNSLRNLVDSIGTDAQLSPIMEKKGILGNTTGRRPGDVTFQRWQKRQGISMLQLPARWLLLMCGWWHPAKTMQLRGSMASMMRVSKAQIIFSALWCSRRLELSTQRERRCSNSCFDSQQSGLVGSLHLTAAALGLACLATCRDQFLNQFLLALMDESFVKRKCGVGVSVGVCSRELACVIDSLSAALP